MVKITGVLALKVQLIKFPVALGRVKIPDLNLPLISRSQPTLTALPLQNQTEKFVIAPASF